MRSRVRLNHFLKELRTRISPQAPALGPHLRLPSRRGRIVSQQEVAACIGVSRTWYVTLESEVQIRPSTALLGRLAETLMLSSEERALLVNLALPELKLQPKRESAVIDAFGSLRRSLQKLWVATTEAEALTIAREYAITQLGLDETVSCVRVCEGHWSFAGTGNSYSDERMQQYQTAIQKRSGLRSVDDIFCYRQLDRPGALITRSERNARYPQTAANEGPVLKAVRLSASSAAMAAIRTRHGLVGRLLAVHYTPHDFSELERELLSTLADATSLALSG